MEFVENLRWKVLKGPLTVKFESFHTMSHERKWHTEELVNNKIAKKKQYRSNVERSWIQKMTHKSITPPRLRVIRGQGKKKRVGRGVGALAAI